MQRILKKIEPYCIVQSKHLNVWISFAGIRIRPGLTGWNRCCFGSTQTLEFPDHLVKLLHCVWVLASRIWKQPELIAIKTLKIPKRPILCILSLTQKQDHLIPRSSAHWRVHFKGLNLDIYKTAEVDFYTESPTSPPHLLMPTKKLYTNLVTWIFPEFRNFDSATIPTCLWLQWHAPWEVWRPRSLHMSVDD